MDDFKVKVCGMTDVANVTEVSESNPDYMGFIFYSRSVRYVGKSPDPALFSSVPAQIRKVAVFVNEYYERMIELTERFEIEYVQLHGMESPEICNQLKVRGKKVIKVIPADHLENEKLIRDYSQMADFFLFDTPVPSYGGSGRKFDWSNLRKLKSGKPFFLSGGISPDDAATVRELDFPGIHAIDINSRFEKRPGIKDPELVSNFLKALRNGEE